VNRAVLLVCCLGLIVFAVGCGGPKNVGGVTGTVTLGGQPVADALVTFSPTAEGGSSGVGKTDSAGKYTLGYSAGVQGAHEGENLVRITTYQEADPDSDPPQPAVPEKIPAKYNVKSDLKVEVKPGSNTIDFPLEAGPVIQPGEGGQGGKRGKASDDGC
jgi:hypothetical protein